MFFIKALVVLTMILFTTLASALPWQVCGEFKIGLEKQTGLYSDIEGEKRYDLDLNFKRTFSLLSGVDLTTMVQAKSEWYPDADINYEQHRDTYRLEFGFVF